MLKKLKLGLPLKLIAIILAALLIGPYLPVEFKSFAYATSLLLKELLLLTMPLIIFSYIFACLLSFKEGSLSFLSGLLGSICLSNFTSTLIAFGLSYAALQSMETLSFGQSQSAVELMPYFIFQLPKLISNDTALFAGIALGAIMSFKRPTKVIEVANKLKDISNFILNRLFIPVLPIFILGFVLKMQQEGTLMASLESYGPVVLVFASCQLAYLMFLFGVGSNFQPHRWIQSIRNVLPAAFTGFSAMSSLAAMPVNLQAARKNSGNHPAVDAIIPATVNVHLIGDSIAIPTLALAILMNFGQPMPDFGSYLMFAFFFVMYKFSVAAVPGGGILVMIPVLQQYLGFSDEMLTLITMLYILFDPIITSVNVTGNNAFAVIFSKFIKRPKVIEDANCVEAIQKPASP